MYKRYHGNSGRVEHVPEHGETLPPPPPARPGAPPRRPGLSDWLGRVLPGSGSSLETEDLLLLLILYLLYRESGDRELLIMMGAMFLL